jgi:CRISPR system Cascade subunit CasD
MKTLNLTISAPIASYGTTPRFQQRLTQYAPTKSAIVGMIACAMGIPRDESIEHLNALSMRVVSVSGGEIEQDLQTVRCAVTNDGTPDRAALTNRHYIPDYCADVELSGDDALIDAVEYAVRFPRWQLFVGRRAHVLDRPLMGISPAAAVVECAAKYRKTLEDLAQG